MLLIFPEQLNKPENIEKVYEIINSKNLVDCAIVGENEKKISEIIQELQELGETKIINMINSGELILIG